MNLVAQIAMVAAETEHHGNVQLETLIFGVIAIIVFAFLGLVTLSYNCLLYTSPSPRDKRQSRMPSSA